MENLVNVHYHQTGQSSKHNELGMREMQAKAYAARHAQYLLLKAPPASGKSRALMFIALDKLAHQGIRKVVIAVPERSIGASFRSTKLREHGFFADWDLDPQYDLCTAGEDNSVGKIAAFAKFLDSDAPILLCTHATLRFAFEACDVAKLNDCLVAIDEFHHISADKANNRLGELFAELMEQSNAHILAMTGSYFRGDGAAIMRPEEELKFSRVTYNYYDQLNGYEHLKTLGIGYHFYQGPYMSAIKDVLDTNLKTLIHIPSVNSLASTACKYTEVEQIFDIIGDDCERDSSTGIYTLKRHGDGKLLRVANLVDDSGIRDKTIAYLRQMKSPDDVDIIIALGMAKEGFDWPACEHALTIGYRGSMTEVVQIIGRCTRDCKGKGHAQFTNLISQPEATDAEVMVAVNNMLKAISCCLLMEQVMAPRFNFAPRDKGEVGENPDPEPGVVKVGGYKKPSTQRVKDILEKDLTDLDANILNNEEVKRAIMAATKEATKLLNKELIPKIIQRDYPDLTEDEVEEVRQGYLLQRVIKPEPKTGGGGQELIRMAEKFINIENLHIDLIDTINPFQQAYEIISKYLDAESFGQIYKTINVNKFEMSLADALDLYPLILAFCKQHGGAHPQANSIDEHEQRLAAAVSVIKKAKKKAKKAQA